jgi:hypothetical protein
LSHVEFVHRPGERELAREFFKLLGTEVVEVMDGRYLVGVIDPATFDAQRNENYFGGTEVRPEQWAFDQALMQALGEGALGERFAAHQAMLDRTPQDGMHFGLHYTTVEEWEDAIARMERAGEQNPELAGRVRVCGVFRPDDPESVTVIHQAFVWTDVIASGSLAFGQRIELSTLAPDAVVDF